MFWKEKHSSEIDCTSTPHFITLHFIAPHKYCIFYKLEARTKPAKWLWLILLQWSGTEPTKALRYACKYTVNYQYKNYVKMVDLFCVYS